MGSYLLIKPNTGKFESLPYTTFRATSAVSNTSKFENLLYMTFRATSAVSNNSKFENLLNYMMVFGIIVAVPNNDTKATTDSRFLHTTGRSKQETMATITQSSRPQQEAANRRPWRLEPKAVDYNRKQQTGDHGD